MSLFKLIPMEQEGIEPGQLLLEVGQTSFTTTGTSVEVKTQLTKLRGAWFTGKVAIGSQDAQDVMITTDGTISSGAITVERPSSGESGFTIYHALVGFKQYLFGRAAINLAALLLIL